MTNAEEAILLESFDKQRLTHEVSDLTDHEHFETSHAHCSDPSHHHAEAGAKDNGHSPDCACPEHAHTEIGNVFIDQGSCEGGHCGHEQHSHIHAHVDRGSHGRHALNLKDITSEKSDTHHDYSYKDDASAAMTHFESVHDGHGHCATCTPIEAVRYINHEAHDYGEVTHRLEEATTLEREQVLQQYDNLNREHITEQRIDLLEPPTQTVKAMAESKGRDAVATREELTPKYRVGFESSIETSQSQQESILIDDTIDSSSLQFEELRLPTAEVSAIDVERARNDAREETVMLTGVDTSEDIIADTSDLDIISDPIIEGFRERTEPLELDEPGIDQSEREMAGYDEMFEGIAVAEIDSETYQTSKDVQTSVALVATDMTSRERVQQEAMRSAMTVEDQVLAIEVMAGAVAELRTLAESTGEDTLGRVYEIVLRVGQYMQPAERLELLQSLQAKDISLLVSKLERLLEQTRAGMFQESSQFVGRQLSIVSSSCSLLGRVVLSVLASLTTRLPQSITSSI